MAPTLSVESKDHLDGLVKNSDKLVVCCFPRPVGQHDHSSSVSFNELAQRLDSVTSCRVDVIAHPQLRTVVAQLLSEEEQRDGDQLGWVFFRSGGKVMRKIHFPTFGITRKTCSWRNLRFFWYKSEYCTAVCTLLQYSVPQVLSTCPLHTNNTVVGVGKRGAYYILFIIWFMVTCQGSTRYWNSLRTTGPVPVDSRQ